jgi:hypothetical protein
MIIFTTNVLDTTTKFIIGAFGAIALGNAFVCYRVAKSDLFEPLQKIFQYLLIWLLPILGAILAFEFTCDHIKSGASGYPANDPTFGVGDDLGGSNGAGDYLLGSHDGDADHL